MQHFHRRWERITLRSGVKTWKQITPQSCKACQPKCQGCGEPFQLSTAEDERHFCSRYCEQHPKKEVRHG